MKKSSKSHPLKPQENFSKPQLILMGLLVSLVKRIFRRGASTSDASDVSSAKSSLSVALVSDPTPEDKYPALFPGCKEIILPSGRFARIKPISLRHYIAIAEYPKEWATAVAMALCVELDDEPMTIEQALELPFKEASPIVVLLNEMIS